MLPGLSNVLRRDKEKQRAAAAGLDNLQSPTQYTSMPRQSSAEFSPANPLLNYSRAPQLTTIQQQQQQQYQQQSSSNSSRSSSQHGMLPEEHRAREREKEKQAKAQLGNAYTQQMMANRQLQQHLTQNRQQQASPSRVSATSV